MLTEYWWVGDQAMKAIYTLILVLLAGTAYGQSNLPACQGSDASKWSNCFGSWTASDGDKYVGEFKDGKRKGQGTYFLLADNQFKGHKYVGEFRDDKFNGHGTYTYAEGDKYVGKFKDDKFNGQGTYYYLADNQFKGDKYVGENKDGKANGQGTYYYLADNQFKGDK